MAGTTLSLSSKVEVFPCPHCAETINTSEATCPHCHEAIDQAAALISAAQTTRISQAVSDASYLRIMAWALLSFFVAALLPFVSLFGAVGLWFLRFAIPFMAIRWWIRYSKIQTTDPDYARARRSAIIVGIIGTLVLITGVAAVVLHYR